VTVPSFEFSTVHAAEIREKVNALRQETGSDFFVALFTNVFENGSDLFAAAESGHLAKMGIADQPRRLPGVMSRKKDFLPRFGNMLRDI
jgi:manganese-dependent inorganic pyrophosphatase